MIQWYRNGNILEEEGSRLLISSAQLKDSGVYQCHAVDGNATHLAESKPLTATVTISQSATVKVVGKSTSLVYKQYRLGWHLYQKFYATYIVGNHSGCMQKCVAVPHN